MRNGYGAPFVKVADAEGNPLPIKVTTFKYRYDEKAGDNCKITIKSDNVAVLDNGDLQPHNKLLVTWGYLGGKVSPTRTLYILDRTEDCNENGVILNLQCYSKAQYLKLSQKQKSQQGVTAKDVGDEIAKDTGVQFVSPDEDALQIVGGLNERQSYLNESGNYVAARSTTAVYQNPKVYNLVQANESDYAHMKKVVDLEPGGPYDLVGRDDKLIMRKRNFDQDPIRNWRWKGEDGQLLSFKYSSNNKQKISAATNVEVSGWSEDGKEYVQANVNALHDDNIRLGEQDVASPRSFDIPGSTVSAKDLKEDSNWNSNTEASFSDELFEEPENAATSQPTTKDAIEKSNPIPAEPSDITNLKTNTGEIAGVLLATERASYLSETGFMTAATSTTRVVKTIPLDMTMRHISKENDFDTMGGDAVNQRAKAAMDMHKAKAKAVGDPRIESGKIASFLGVGEKNSGNWYLDAVVHTISESAAYLIDLELARNAEGKTDAKGGTVTSKSTKSEVNTFTSNNTEPEERKSPKEERGDKPASSNQCRGLTGKEIDKLDTVRFINNQIIPFITSPGIDPTLKSIQVKTRLRSKGINNKEELNTFKSVVTGIKSKLTRGTICTSNPSDSNKFVNDITIFLNSYNLLNDAY